MSDVEIAVYGLATLFISGFSAIAGGGGGFILTPLLIFLGLTLAQAITNGKAMSLSEITASLYVLRKKKLHSWSIALPFMVVAVVIALIVPYFITRIEGDVYQRVIGVLLIVMAPVLYYRKVGHTKKVVQKQQKVLGYCAVAGSMLLQGLFSSGLGMLVNISMASFMGMSALEVNVTKRLTQLLLNGIITIGLLGSGLILWKLVVFGVIANFIGGYIGAHTAVKRGNIFVMNIMIAAMLMSGIALIAI